LVQFLPTEDKPDAHAPSSPILLYNVKKESANRRLPLLPPGLKLAHAPFQATSAAPRPSGNLPFHEVIALSPGRYHDISTTFTVADIDRQPRPLGDDGESPRRRQQGNPHYILGVQINDAGAWSASIVSWEPSIFDGLYVLDRVKLTGFEVKTNPFTPDKDLITKKGHTIERITPILSTTWTLDRLLALLRTQVASRRSGRFALVNANIYKMKTQPSANLPYTQYILRDGAVSGFGRFYGHFADLAAAMLDGTTLTLVQPRAELEGAPGEEAVVLTLDDQLDPMCAIAQ